MLNKINTLLSSVTPTTIKEFKITSYTDANPTTASTITLPAGINEGSLGLLLITVTQGNTGSAATQFGVPTGFTLINKASGITSGGGRAAAQALFYKYMNSSDSSTVISTLFANNGGKADLFFIEVVLDKSISLRGFDTLSNISVQQSSSTAVTLTDVPSVILAGSPFFLLTCAIDGVGGTGSVAGTLTGGMQLYYTSTTVLINDGTIFITLWKYDNINIKDLPSTEDAIYTVSGTTYTSSGAYAIWMK